jgi:hypothetical protein
MGSRDVDVCVLLCFRVATLEIPSVVHGVARVGTPDRKFDKCRDVFGESTTAGRVDGEFLGSWVRV